MFHLPQEVVVLVPFKATPTQALDFMMDLFEPGPGYSATNTVRSSLSQVLPISSGVHLENYQL